MAGASGMAWLWRMAAVLLAFALAVPTPLLAQPQAPRPDMVDRGTARLVAEDPVPPGETMDLALVFEPNDGWHGYWANPGDAGQGMTLDWSLPAGWKAGEPQYPVPQRLVIAGLMNHVYEGEHAVLVPLAVPEDAQPGSSYPVSVFAQWLTCSDTLCVPQWATLSTVVQVGTAGAQVGLSDDFNRWRAALPPPLDSEAQFEIARGLLRLAIPLPASFALQDPHVFIENTQLVDYAAEQAFYRDGDLLIAELPLAEVMTDPDGVTGILKLDDSGNGITFSAAAGEVPTGGTRLAGGQQAALAPLWLLLGGALLGGLLLNVMPCVFPILSLKAMTLARAGESEGEARREGLAYTAGVILACLALGGLLLVLRAGGSEIGWAFQLQEPGVVVALLVLAAAITANFAGLYELPSLSITRAGGRQSAFATGLLAAFVATPCTGPFMAAALGAALLLPWWQALALFATLGLGLALPFLLLGFVPAFRRILPKPGRWMETFRKVLAVPMGLTALALLWLTWRLGGLLFVAAAFVLSAAVIVVLMAWQRGPKITALAPLLAGAAMVLILPVVHEPRSAAAEESLHEPIAFSDAILAEARASGKPVFLWFTADWCVTCKVNEGVAIEREATRDAFEEAGVIAMRGDWTRRDPAITRFLTDRGVAGVPLYLWYPPGGGEQQLPQILTPDSLVDLAEATR